MMWNIITLAPIIMGASAVDWISRGDVYYYISELWGPQPNARRECLKLGADLASIVDQSENDFITNLTIGPSTYWIGLYTDNPCDDCRSGSKSTACATCRNGWRWQDNKRFPYHNWYFNQPGINESCGILSSIGTWFDTNCMIYNKYICKLKDIDECNHSLREVFCNHGTCTNTMGDYYCSCSEGYSGRHCDKQASTAQQSNNHSNKNDTTGLLIGIIILSSIVGAGVLTLVGYILYLRLKKRAENEMTSEVPNNGDSHVNMACEEDTTSAADNSAQRYESIRLEDATPRMEKETPYESIRVYENTR